jgi:predicted permease
MLRLMKEIRVAFRSLTKSPGYLLVVVGSLALGIGANTAIFSLLDAILLKPLPGLTDAEELVMVYRSKEENLHGAISYLNYQDFAEAEAGLSKLAVFADLQFSMADDGPSERIDGMIVSNNYFSLLGLQAAQGRVFGAGESNYQLVVIAHSLWMRSFGGDPSLVGREIRLNGAQLTVIGITPLGFRGIDRISSPEIWAPMDIYHDVVTGPMAQFDPLEARGESWFRMVGRRDPAVSLEEAQSRLEGVSRELEQTWPESNEGWRVNVVPLSEVVFGPGNREKVLNYSGQLMALAALVLLMTCINVASLVSARGAAKRRQLAIRFSLGATRFSLIRHLVVESLVLAGLGGLAGLAVARLAWPLLERLQLPSDVLVNMEPSGRVLGFALLVSLVTGLVIGMAPALGTSAGIKLAPALKGDAPMPGRLRRFAFRDLLVVVQIAFALVILVGSTLLVRTLGNLQSIDLGFDAKNTLMASLDLRPAGYKETPEIAGFFRDLVERLEGRPEVEQATIVAAALPTSPFRVRWRIVVDGYEPQPEEQVTASVGVVGANYFKTLKIPFREGRDFDARSLSGGAGVVIVNEAMTRRYWPNEEALGKVVRLSGPEGDPYQVIGLVADSTHGAVREQAEPFVYVYHGQNTRSMIAGALEPNMSLLVRTKGDPLKFAATLREEVRAMDPRLPLFGVTTLEDSLSDAIRLERQAAQLFSAFALLALILAAVGLYGVMAFQVGQRTREVGIRVAMGARTGTVIRWVLSWSGTLVVGGAVTGLVAAWFLARLLATQLYGVALGDPTTYLMALAILCIIGLLAGLMPALRAARIDPVRALRAE